MNTAVYTRYELLRAMRNRRVIIFSLAFPVILYLAIVAPNRDVADFSGTGISLPALLHGRPGGLRDDERDAGQRRPDRRRSRRRLEPPAARQPALARRPTSGRRS